MHCLNKLHVLHEYNSAYRGDRSSIEVKGQDQQDED